MYLKPHGAVSRCGRTHGHMSVRGVSQHDVCSLSQLVVSCLSRTVALAAGRRTPCVVWYWLVRWASAGLGWSYAVSVGYAEPAEHAEHAEAEQTTQGVRRRLSSI